MTVEATTLLALGILVIAFLYSSVGHAGASGYIAVMSLAGLAPAVIKPTALSLNVMVACLATWHFYCAGHFSWRLFWPFALLAAPFAFLGGYVTLPTAVFRALVGVVLLASAARLLMRPPVEQAATPPRRGVALSVGALLGLLSGLTGTGGGIFLTPLLLLRRWATTKTAAAVSAAFILANSLSGLAGHVAGTRSLPTLALPLAAAALVGGAAGSFLGSHRFSPVLIKRLLAVVLLIAGTKLILAP